MKTKLKSILAVALCAVGFAALAAEQDPVEYLDWDDNKKELTSATCTAYEVVTKDTATFEAGKTYVVTNDVINASVPRGITVEGTEATPARLILCDGAKLTVQGQDGAETAALNVSNGTAIVICGQKDGTGVLEATGGAGAAGIGGNSGQAGGMVTINGGTVTATGGTQAAGIGGGCGNPSGGAGGTVTINGGTVTATGKDGGAGIGGGTVATDHGTVTFGGAGFNVVTGETAAVTVPIAQEDYEKDHSARYAHIEPPPVKVDALSNEFALDLTAGDRIAQDTETLVVDPAWDETDPTLAKVRIDGEDEPRTYTCASNDLWQTASLEPGRYEAELMTACSSYLAGFWKVGDDWTVFDSSNITADVTFEAGKTYLVLGTNTVDATLTVTDGAKFEYDERAPAGFLGGTVDLPKRYAKETVEGEFYQIVEKIKGCEDNPWEVGGTDGTDDLVTAWTNGTELVIDGTGAVTNLADVAKGGLTAVKISKPTVTGAAKDAFAGVGGESAVKVSLPDGWQGELPDEDGNLYGMKVDMANFVYPMAVKNVKFLQRYPWNGLVDISCDLSGAGAVTLKVTTLTNDVTFVANPTLEGETTIDLGAGCATNGVKFIWNAAADLPAGFKGQGIKVKVTVEKAPPPPAGQLWANGPIWEDANFGESEDKDHLEYGALYKFDGATNAVAQLTDGRRLPTKDELQALIDNCDSAWNDAKKGYTFTGKGVYSSSSIFLPAAGYEFVGSGGRFNAGDKGIYWSATPDSWETDRAYSLDISKDGGVEVIDGDFGCGSSVRLVKDAAK